MSSDPLISKTIGNYEILDRVGRGGMATVYRARQLNMNREVAIKVMSAQLSEDPQFVARFEREAQTIANLQHPRILPVHDFGRDGDLFYLVMRLVEGETLHTRMTRGPLPLDRAVHFTIQIAEALDYAHAHGIIHRDLKPNNILIDEYDNVYMMDFGLAKIVASSSHLTASGTVLGTPAYMAPEQWRGEAVDARTDVYALGVILYEMVVGSQPFIASDTPFSLMYRHLNDTPPLPRESRPDLPAAVDQVILKALAKDPAERYPSAGELARAFSEAVFGNGAHVSPGPPPPPATGVRRARLEEPVAEPELPPTPPTVPPPPFIAPPVESSAPTVPPIPVPSGRRKAHLPDEDVLLPRKPHDPDLPFDLPPTTPPAVRNVIEWAAEKMEKVNIPGFIVADEDEEPLAEPVIEPQVDSGQFPQDAAALQQVGYVLRPDEELTGALYVRGTDDWRGIRRLIFVGLALSIFGSLFGSLFNLGILGLVSTVIWIYLIIVAWRTWKGRIGHFYVGFTPRRIVVLPLTPGAMPLPDDVSSAYWDDIYRFYMSEEHLWIEAAGVESLYFLGWIPVRGWGDLGRQRKWLRASPIAALVRAKGYTIKR